MQESALRHRPEPSRPPRADGRSRFATRFEWWTARLALPVAAGAAFIVGVLVLRGASAWTIAVPLLIFALFPAIAAVGTAVSRRALKRHQYLLCLDCLYPLEGLEPRSVCPECGRVYSAESVQRTWADQYSRRHPLDLPPEEQA